MSSSAKDVVLVGAGIMSATLAVLIKLLQPDWQVVVVESGDRVATESSSPWNNAGTGHAAFCELNYTPERGGVIDISKALDINRQFCISCDFWFYLAKQGALGRTEDFIRRVPHMTFVRGKKDVDFLKKRYDLLVQNPLFAKMVFLQDPEEIKKIAPLLIDGRKEPDPIALTSVDLATDINFGVLTERLLSFARELGAEVLFNTRVVDLRRVAQSGEGANWIVQCKRKGEGNFTPHAGFVFVGAGGATLRLLQKSQIGEVKGYGGFPISGLFLRSGSENIAQAHTAKVYGKASVGAPPMSVPHLDTRFVDGKRWLLFGPYAGFNTKFLKHGSYFDLFASLSFGNFYSYLFAGLKNFNLVKYLVSQVFLSKKARFAQLQEFFPNAKEEDWELIQAGQRVQIIKPNPKGRGSVLQLGTEVILSDDCSMSGLLGASPGASVSVSVMLDLLLRAWDKKTTQGWQERLQSIVPSYFVDPNSSQILADEAHSRLKQLLEAG